MRCVWFGMQLLCVGVAWVDLWTLQLQMASEHVWVLVMISSRVCLMRMLLEMASRFPATATTAVKVGCRSALP